MVTRAVICAVCASANAQRLFRPKRSPGPAVRCQRCGLIYIAPIEDDRALIDGGPVLKDGNKRLLNSADLGDLAGSWELPLLEGKQAEWPALRINAADALKRIERYARPGRILDFGCGSGFFLGAAKQRGWDTYGLEPLPGHAIYARATFGVTVIADVLRVDSFAPKYFDAITAFQVFEHLPDPADALHKLATFMRPGGVLLIEVPNIDTWSVRMLGRRHRHFVQDHLTFFSKHTLRRLLETSGLKVLDTYYPTRYMTLHHLLIGWGSRFVPAGLAKHMRRIRSAQLNRIIPMNMGDIVAVIAQKPL